MRILIGLLVLAVGPAFSADQDYNGRWDITTASQRPRAWWLELNGVGTPQAKGKFVSAYAGDMNKIDRISVENGELHFTIVQPGRGGAASRAMNYRARLNGGKLEGTLETEGQSGGPVKWTGVRAP